MKNLITIACLLFTIITYSQSFNNEIISEESKPKLLGKINKEGLSSKNYSDWFNKNYTNYQSNTKVIKLLSEDLSKYTITMFLGTWCGDSKKEVPIFYKVLEEAQFPMDRLTVIAVDRERETYKQSPGGEHEGMNIHRVPTFIINEEGKEINRIVEHPVKSMEEDLLAIIEGAYNPNYQIVSYANNYLKEMGVETFNKKRKKVLKKLQPMAMKFSELNTYSSVLFYSDKKEEAIVIARLNSDLYPESDNGYTNLAVKLYNSNKKEEAFNYFNKALEINPENKTAKKFIAFQSENVAN